jgi:hypothetical protein
MDKAQQKRLEAIIWNEAIEAAKIMASVSGSMRQDRQDFD